MLIFALVLSLGVLLAFGALVSTTQTMGKQANYQLAEGQALAIAEGVLDAAQKEIRDKAAAFEPVPTSGTVTMGGGNYGPLQVYTYTVAPVGGESTQTDSDGVSRTVQHYRVSTTVSKGEAQVTLERIVSLNLTPVFQYMVFYTDDLEILPGPSMTLGGRVHANGDIYIGCGNTLTVDTEYLRCTGKIYRQRKNDGSPTGGTVNIKVAGSPNYAEMDSAHDSTYADWTNYALDTWNGTVQDTSHGVTEVSAPPIGSIKAYNPDGSKGYYHANAGLVIKDGQAYDQNGDPVSLPPGTIQEKTMYDGREGTYVTVTEIDIGLLNSSGKFPANGLIYAWRTDASQNQPNGIRLTNGSELAAPLTVVSEDPVYVHGDFNTVNKKGAAVIADAVNLLSNAWDDSKTPGTLPAASDTTYNLAFITGNVPTPDGGGNYSGGLENLPRFHENWRRKRATIRGSFINMFESEIARGNWSYGGDVYKAPIRDWAYDPDLTGMQNMPPFTPNAVEVKQVYWDDNKDLPFLATGG